MTEEKARLQEHVRRAEVRYKRARRVFLYLFGVGFIATCAVLYLLIGMLLTHRFEHRFTFFIAAPVAVATLPLVIIFGLELLAARREAERAYERYKIES